MHHLRPLPSAHRRPLAAQRTFSTIHSRQNAEINDPSPPARANIGGTYRNLGQSGSGRIVGKRGRKQRQTTEALATKSLGEKSEIVILRDVFETRKKPVDKPRDSLDEDFGEQSLKGLSLTADQIREAMSESTQAPDEEDVYQSIEALRPQAPVMEEKEFDRLIKELLDGYNMSQLSRYLRRSLSSHQSSMTVVRELEYSHGVGTKSKAPPKRTISFTRSRWQPGRTPLEQRRISNIPVPSPQLTRGPSGPKARAAERIVRMAWGVTTAVEEQRMGELEIQMMPWALALFFDTVSNGRPQYQALIEPPMLVRKSEIRPYRLDNIIRITARRQDADDIATQLENKVLLMGKQVLQLDKLISSSGGKFPPRQSLKYFRKLDLEEISLRTQSIFMQQNDGSIAIYSFKQSDRANARRLLLSLLDLSSRNAKIVAVNASTSQQAKVSAESLALVPIFPDRGVHFRDRSKILTRATLPVRRAGLAPNPETSYTNRAQELSREIQALVPDFHKHEKVERPTSRGRPSVISSYWEGRRFATSSSLWVDLGLLLQESTIGTSGALMQGKTVDETKFTEIATHSKKPVFLRQVPAFEVLLSYFDPKRPPKYPTKGVEAAPANLTTRRSTIVAHFSPNAFTARGDKALELFPKMELTMLRRLGKDTEDELKVIGLRGIIEDQHVDIPLPDRAIDIRLTKKISAHAHTSAILADAQIQQFVKTLKDSVDSKGSLEGTTEINFKLPAWMAETNAAARTAQSDSRPEITVSYLFDRFEVVQNTTYAKNTEAIDQRAEHSTFISLFNQSFPQSARLQYKEIEAGDIGGRQTEISFKVHENVPGNDDSDNSEDKQLQVDEPKQDDRVPLEAVLAPALAVADFITLSAGNEITAWRGSTHSAVRLFNVRDPEPRGNEGENEANADGTEVKDRQDEVEAEAKL